MVGALLECNSPWSGANVPATQLKNEQVFKTVIDHYSINASDSLKLRATRFLIENMSDKVTLVGAAESSIDTLSSRIFWLRKSVYFSPNTQEAIVKAVFDTLRLFRSLNELRGTSSTVKCFWYILNFTSVFPLLIQAFGSGDDRQLNRIYFKGVPF
jgi:hypothetical protein